MFLCYFHFFHCCLCILPQTISTAHVRPPCRKAISNGHCRIDFIETSLVSSYCNATVKHEESALGGPGGCAIRGGEVKGPDLRPGTRSVTLTLGPKKGLTFGRAFDGTGVERCTRVDRGRWSRGGAGFKGVRRLVRAYDYFHFTFRS